MTPDEWQRVKDVLAAALSLDTGGQQALIGHELAHSPQLRDEAFELLTHYRLATQRLPGLSAIFAGVGGGWGASTWPETLPSAHHLEPGDMCGRYEVVRLLGSGGMARVYLATDTELSTQVALKVLSEQLLESSEARIRLRGEAHNAARLRGHPHIATFLDLIHVDVKGRQFPVIVMEYVAGKSCAEHLAEHPVSLGRALRWASQVAEAVEYAHDHGVLHCDLKPHNIQVGADDRIKVLDFGVARALYGPSTAETVTGTVPYMAPEQIGERRFTESGDIYSLGVTFFELLTRQRPFAAADQGELVLKVLGEPAPAVSSLLPDVPVTVDVLVGRMLSKAARHRPQSVSELRREIDAVLLALEPPPPARARRWPALVASVGTVFVALTFIGFMSSLMYDTALGRTGRFDTEPALWWPVWGVRMLNAPLVIVAMLSVPVFAGVMLTRWLWTKSGWASPFARFARIPSYQLGLAVLLASVVALNTFFIRFNDAFQALGELTSAGVAADRLVWLNPENYAEHNLYRFASLVLWFGMTLAWAALLRRRRDLLQAPWIVLPLLGVVVIGAALTVWSMPYRLLWQAQLNRADLAGEPCYVAGQRDADLLLFCPKGQPRTRTVSAADPRLIRDSKAEKIFTPLTPSPR
jgi:hypothetical protein